MLSFDHLTDIICHKIIAKQLKQAYLIRTGREVVGDWYGIGIECVENWKRYIGAGRGLVGAGRELVGAW